MHPIESESEIRAVLESARTIAVLGAHDEPSRPAFYVPDYLDSQGYRVLPVNPALVGHVLWGHTVRANLRDIGEHVDIVDVFRRCEALPAHVDEILAMDPRPRVVWLQLGIRNDLFASKLLAAGIGVVQDRCTLADHRRMGLGRVKR